ncbi:hypothetical protein [Paracoccus indicus]|uniref:hypothetical protein n=1 Tax=Paracoccus indicus TaxID=2079229 RepID=UPI000D3BB44B|nr:hypothetical protein [Paracoccus indicus]
MSIFVYPWPPVGAVGSEWTSDQPVSRLRSGITGRDVMQASQRRRRMATLIVSSLANGRAGAGYCEMLKQLLDGGVHAVRLQSSPINWWLDELDRQSPELNPTLMTWQRPPEAIAWQQDGAPITWVVGGSVLGGTPTTSGPWGYLPVTGLPPGVTVARPGDFIRITSMSDPGIWEIARVMRPATTNGAGAVTLKLDRTPTIAGGRVNMAGQDEGVFRVEGDLPRAVQPVSGDWQYSWTFREIFADEVGGFEERPGTWT